MSRSKGLLIAAFAMAVPMVIYAAQAAQKKGAEPTPAKKMDMPMAAKSTMTDAQKIASAESAAPAAIAKNATIMDWPAKEGDKMKQLRAGTNGWTCMPTSPGGGPRVDPMCLDKQWASWAEGYMNHAAAPPKVNGTGIGYMRKV